MLVSTRPVLEAKTFGPALIIFGFSLSFLATKRLVVAIILEPILKKTLIAKSRIRKKIRALSGVNRMVNSTTRIKNAFTRTTFSFTRFFETGQIKSIQIKILV